MKRESTRAYSDNQRIIAGIDNHQMSIRAAVESLEILRGNKGRNVLFSIGATQSCLKSMVALVDVHQKSIRATIDSLDTLRGIEEREVSFNISATQYCLDTTVELVNSHQKSIRVAIGSLGHLGRMERHVVLFNLHATQQCLKTATALVDGHQERIRTTIGSLDPSYAIKKRNVLFSIGASQQCLETASALVVDHQERIRAEVDSLDHLQGMSEYNVISKFVANNQHLINIAATQAKRFHLPEKSELIELVAKYKNNIIKSIANRYEQEIDLALKIQTIQHPWLEISNESKSIGRLAKLHYIGHALKAKHAFDENLVNPLRHDLGDWREQMDLTAFDFTDLSTRANFYLERGLDPNLTDFSNSAFEENASISGIKIKLPSTAKEYDLKTDNLSDEVGLERMIIAYGYILQLEIYMRCFIDERMTQEYGLNWQKSGIPNEMRKQWIEKREKANSNGKQDLPLVQYADFTDYVQIIVQRNNWDKVFKSVFKRQSSVIESFQRLFPIRISIAHSRLITKEDELYLYVESQRLLKAIGVLQYPFSIH